MAMDTLLFLLGVVSLVAMVVGLIKPSIVIRWGEKKTRVRALLIYGGLFIFLMTAGYLSVTPEEKAAIAESARIERQQKAAEEKIAKEKADKKAAEDKEKSDKASKEAAVIGPEIKYTDEQAIKLVADWFWNHQFPTLGEFSVGKGKVDGSFYEKDGKNYYLFCVSGFPRTVDVLVDPYTGELFFNDIGIKPYSLDKWYLDYTASHKGNNPQANVRISENFEWVEMHSVQGRYIVGKVKNISNRTLECRIEFNLYDKDLNQIGVVVDNIKNLKAGNTWAFKVYVDKSNVEKYQFDGIRYW